MNDRFQGRWPSFSDIARASAFVPHPSPSSEQLRSSASSGKLIINNNYVSSLFLNCANIAKQCTNFIIIHNRAVCMSASWQILQVLFKSRRNLLLISCYHSTLSWCDIQTNSDIVLLAVIYFSPIFPQVRLLYVPLCTQYTQLKLVLHIIHTASRLMSLLGGRASYANDVQTENSCCLDTSQLLQLPR